MKFVKQCFVIIFIAFYSSDIAAIEDILGIQQTGRIKCAMSDKHTEMLFKVQAKRYMYNKLNANGKSLLSKELDIVNNIDSSLSFFESDNSADYCTIPLPEGDWIPRSQTPQLDLEHAVVDPDNVDITFNILFPKYHK